MLIGTAPITWGVSEMADWGDVLPPGRVLDEMAGTGYRGTELGPTGYFPDDVDQLRRELAKRDLAMIGGFCPVTLHQPATQMQQRTLARDVAGRLRDLGASVLVLAEAGDAARLAAAGHVQADRTPAFDGDDWRRFAEAAGAIATEAKAMGLITAFHPHVGSYVETEDEVERLVALTDPAILGLCIDTGHLAYAGADPVALTRRHRSRVLHVHLKDVSSPVLDQARRQGWSFADAVGQCIFVPLGEGTVDLSGMLEILRSTAYDAWLVVEQDTRLLRQAQSSEPARHARRSRQYLGRFGL